MGIENKVVVVTGGGAGIGRALAREFLRLGAHVAILTRSLPKPMNLPPSDEERLLTLITDVTSKFEVADAIKRIETRFGRADVLVNNAGIHKNEFFKDANWDEWAKVFEVNALGTMLCTHGFLQLMMKNRYGRIINIVSRNGEDSTMKRTAYGASKAAVVVFTKKLAVEHRSFGTDDILINALIPGLTQTNMSSKGQAPEDVFPHCLKLACLPAKGPSGRVFFNGEDYPFFANFNDINPPA